MMADAAQSVRLVLEEIGVDGADTDAERLGVGLQFRPVIDRVPGNVKGDRRADAGKAVHHGGIGQLLAHVAGGSGPSKNGEAGAAIAVSPGRCLYALGLEGPLDGLDVQPFLCKLSRKESVGLGVVSHVVIFQLPFTLSMTHRG